MKSKKISFLEINKAWWEKKVMENSVFTKPWLELDKNILNKYAHGKLKNPKYPLNDIYPALVLKKVKNKDVLLLAAGGGQQSAIFGLLEANVTVMDISEGQLENDEKVAKHYGYSTR